MGKKLLILTAAGASSPFGVFRVDQVDDFLEEICESDLKDGEFPHGFVGDRSLKINNENAFRFLKNMAKSEIDKNANFETVLRLLSRLAAEKVHAMNDGKPGRYDVFTNCPHYRPSNGKYDLERLHQRFVDEILTRFQDRSGGIKDQALSDYRTFLKRLEINYNLRCYTLNYDDLLLRALSCTIGAGFESEGKTFDFDLFKKHQTKDRMPCVHLHGSIYFKVDIDSTQWTMKWENPPRKSSSMGKSPAVASDNITIPRSPIIAGGYKREQIDRSPYLDYFKALDEDAASADALLIIGYGFLDRHVNDAIFKMRKKPIYVVDFSKSDTKLCLEEKISETFKQDVNLWVTRSGFRENENIKLDLQGLPKSFGSVKEILKHFEKDNRFKVFTMILTLFKRIMKAVGMKN